MSKPLQMPNNDDIDSAPEKFIIEEQVKRPVKEEKNIDEKINEELMSKYGLKGEDILKIGNEIQKQHAAQKNDYATEVRKLITEKVDELRKDVDAKISENEFEIERNISNIKEQYLPPNKKK